MKVAFHCSFSLLQHVEQSDEELPFGVRLIRSASGQRKLRFQQNLLIHYSNNSLQVRLCSESQAESFKSKIYILYLLHSVQTVPLCAHLDLVTLSLSSDSISFGFCYVGQTQTAEVNLYSHGSHTYWKSHIGTEDVM